MRPTWRANRSVASRPKTTISRPHHADSKTEIAPTLLRVRSSHVGATRPLSGHPGCPSTSAKSCQFSVYRDPVTAGRKTCSTPVWRGRHVCRRLPLRATRVSSGARATRETPVHRSATVAARHPQDRFDASPGSPATDPGTFRELAEHSRDVVWVRDPLVGRVDLRQCGLRADLGTNRTGPRSHQRRMASGHSCRR